MATVVGMVKIFEALIIMERVSSQCPSPVQLTSLRVPKGLHSGAKPFGLGSPKLAFLSAVGCAEAVSLNWEFPKELEFP